MGWERIEFGRCGWWERGGSEGFAGAIVWVGSICFSSAGYAVLGRKIDGLRKSSAHPTFHYLLLECYIVSVVTGPHLVSFCS